MVINMKYVVMLGDGMGDRPVAELKHKTPLGAADKPCMDALAREGDCGLTGMLRENLPLGSDVANLAVLGYDPAKYYTGRSPIEALGVGIEVGKNDMVFRCNLVNVRGSGETAVMVDHSSDKITDEEGKVLCAFLQERLGGGAFNFYFGASYRNIMIWRGGRLKCGADLNLTPPHDILERNVKDYLPKGEGGAELFDLMQKAEGLLANHPININRRARGLRDANRIWFWGEGTRPMLDSYYLKYGKTAAMVTAVPLLLGIAKGTGMRVMPVEHVTGDINTNFEGKGQAALKALEEGADLVFIHVEAPDECGHDGNAEEKKLSIEYIDRRTLAPVVNALKSKGEPFKVLLLPDHATPICERTHTLDPIPFVIWSSERRGRYNADAFDEQSAAATGLYIPDGCSLMKRFLDDTIGC